jgi:hypothetical protein
LRADGKVVGVTTLARLDGQNLNFAVRVEELSRLLWVRGPLQSFRSAGRKTGSPALVWTAEEKRDIARFFRAHKLEQDATNALVARIAPGRPPLTRADYYELEQLFWAPLTEAREVGSMTFAKAHQGLPAAFEKFKRHVELTVFHLGEKRIDSEGLPYRRQWEDWFAANKDDIQFPDEVPVRHHDILTEDWAEKCTLFDGLRLPKFVPE